MLTNAMEEEGMKPINVSGWWASVDYDEGHRTGIQEE